MSAWILVISAKYDDHLKMAIQDGFWDTRKKRNVSESDDIFFWQSGKGFVGCFRATSGTYPITSTDAENHWHDKNEPDAYKFRFDMALVSLTLSRPSSTWTQMQKATGTRMIASNGAIGIESPDGIDYLRNHFVHNKIDFAYFAGEEYEYGGDSRTRAERGIVVRRGQSAFRSRLLSAYAGKCVVTRSPVPAILEAAHIDPYWGDASDVTKNGFLLRSDIHTLFDLHLLTVDRNLRVHVAPELSPSEYTQYENTLIARPKHQSELPDQAALARHRKRCLWFT